MPALSSFIPAQAIQITDFFDPAISNGVAAFVGKAADGLAQGIYTFPVNRTIRHHKRSLHRHGPFLQGFQLQVTVAFQPNGLGKVAGTITIMDNARKDPQKVKLLGFGMNQ